MGFEIGQTAGGYEFIDFLGSSKDDVAYKVRNTLSNRLEMLKVLPKKFQDDQERVSRFLREIKVHSRLIHPNIVSFYNATELDGHLVMTTELVEGTTLAERLQLGPLPWREAATFMSQALSALSYTHAHGIVHRDISPANMIVTPDGTVRLTGFNLAKGTIDPHLTQLGAVVGSLHYMSPEQVKGLATLDVRSDIYSVGAVLYQAATGQMPFESKSQFEVMLAHVNNAPKPPNEINPDLPAELSEAILKAMAKDPAQRFQTADEFRAALDKITLGRAETEPAPAPVPVPTVATAPGSPWGFAEMAAAGVAMFLLAMVAFLAFLTKP
jgi:serine/threonine protein kinase